MKYFGIQFLISNIYISFFIIFIIVIKRLLKKYISANFQYYLWFILSILLIIPFIHIPIDNHNILNSFSLNTVSTLHNITTPVQDTLLEQVYDYTVSINQQIPYLINQIIIIIWLIGIIFVSIFYFHSWRKILSIKKEAVKLNNNKIISIYIKCLRELKISKNIPIYDTALLKSPALIGLIHPGIYLPMQYINQLKDKDIRYILLHELQHYHHKDILINYLIHFIHIIYWFNPIVIFAIEKMKSDREIACDYAVLKLLDKNEYLDYGYTLINFIEKVSFSPFLSSISSQMKQMTKRIINIKEYKKVTTKQKFQNILAYALVIILSIQIVPYISVSAYENDIYDFSKENNVINIDLSSFYDNYNGSFVLYDSTNDRWNIYNENIAIKRISPYSTYKIYDALLGLESQVIDNQNSTIKYKGEKYPFEDWQQDQNLNTAMRYSVNWYFQYIDNTLGYHKIKSYIHDIEYGNQTISHDINNYWMDDSLRISPIEQVELIQKFNQNDFHFSNDNINAVKQSIHILSNNQVSLYGKTGTGRVNNKDIHGWFIGFIETDNNVYYFAVNIQGENNTNGNKAYKITKDILSYMNII